MFEKNKYINKSYEALQKEFNSEIDLLYLAIPKFFEVNKIDEHNFKFLRPQLLTDKLICHIVVLTLTLLDYKFQSNLLMNTLKLDTKKWI